MNLRWKRKDEKPAEKPKEEVIMEEKKVAEDKKKAPPSPPTPNNPGFFSSLFRRKQINDQNANVVLQSHDIVSETSRFTSKFFSDFTFKRIRGKGGSGCVFHVTNKHDGMEYAVKRIAVPSSEMNKTIQEVCLMASLDHPGIVVYNRTWIEEPPEGWQHEADISMLEKIGSTVDSLIDYKNDAIFIYIQMKLYKKSLEDWLRDNRTLTSRSLPNIKLWFKQIVSAVEYIHKRNIIHCDLKPSNILIDDDNQLKLCDLGIGTEREIENGEEIVASRSAVCSPLYMSPEQSPLFPRYSTKTDVFALGLILTEMCAVMSDEERAKNFDSYRFGLPPYGLTDDEETAKFAAWLAEKSSKKRPECFAILRHKYLTPEEKVECAPEICPPVSPVTVIKSKFVRFADEDSYLEPHYCDICDPPTLLDEILYG